jgi:hypothetical protein
MNFLIRIYRLRQPLNVFHKMLRVFGCEASFFSVAHHRPLIWIEKCRGSPLVVVVRPFFQ